MSIRDERKQQSRQALLDAALRLSTSEGSFSKISLREVTREVGLVPTAFYRHFQDMDELGLELVDQAALHLKNSLHRLSRHYLKPSEISSQSLFDFFFAIVDQNPQAWLFMIAERWGGSKVIRLAIAREIEYLNQDLLKDLSKLKRFGNLKNEDDLTVLSNMLINLACTWIISWITLVQNTQSSSLTAEKIALKHQIIMQVEFMLSTIAHEQHQNSAIE